VHDTYVSDLYSVGMQTERQPRCRCRVGPGSFEVRARVERFAEPAVLLLLAGGPSYGYELVDEGRQGRLRQPLPAAALGRGRGPRRHLVER